MLLTLWLACLPRSAAEVEALGDSPDDVEVLVRALRSRDDEVWQTAYGELLDAGPDLVSAELRESVIKRKSEAPRAILLLGELGDPANFDLLNSALDVPSLEPWAEEAFVLAEESLYLRIADDPSVPLCDSYLAWFPGGASVPEVEDLRYQEQAWQAFSELGRTPDEVDLVGFARRFPGTDAETEAFDRVAALRVRAAEDELTKGRPERALDALAQAKVYAPDLDTDALEARARTELAKSHLGRARTDEAILEMEEARRLGAHNQDTLGALYVQRARERFAAVDPVGGMEDLLAAEAVHPELATTVSQIRQLQVEPLLEQLRGVGPQRTAAVEALLMAGPEHRDALSRVLFERLDAGDCAPVVQLMHVAPRQDAVPWARGEVAKALKVADQRVQTFLHPTSVSALVEGDSLLSVESRSFRGEALGQLVCYERLVVAAQKERDAGARFAKDLVPVPAPRSDAELTARAREGIRPEDDGQPRLFRVQLLRWALEGPERLVQLVQRDPAVLAAVFAAGAATPTDLVGWRLLESSAAAMDPGEAKTVDLGEGFAGAMSTRREGSTLRLILSLEGAERPFATDKMGAPLNVLFGCARLMFFAMPGVDKLEVMVEAGGVEVVMLGLDRRSSDRLSWALIEAEAPYTADHLALVLDQRLR
jgi:hypothetical protein